MEGLGVDVIINQEILSKAPHCLHGPTLLFERNGKRRFYACSACRDRKDCRFFQWEDAKANISLRPNSSCQSYSVTADPTLRLKQFQKLPDNEKQFCHSCTLLLLPEDKKVHEGHDLATITDQQLKEPMRILKPFESSRKEAQFLFTERTVDFFVSTLSRLLIESVLCIGCPKIHERIQNKSCLQSLLLDLDHRQKQFYDANHFCHYNMFNHHFFDGEIGRKTYNKFLGTCGSQKVAILLDPPFGGMIKPLDFTLKQIEADWQKQGPVMELLPIFWVFPYFMEQKIVASEPRFQMLDYEVDYENHPLFKSNVKGRHRSPIRIFTTVPPSQIPLPEGEGYRFCALCQRYVAKENQHCNICEACPSKDGRPYRHCEICERCVKVGHVHCAECKSCRASGHTCGSGSVGCYICGDLSHKQKSCPKKRGKGPKNFRNKRRK